MEMSCDDPGIVIRQPLGSCMLRIFNHYVEKSQQLDSLENITKFDVVRFYRSTFPHKRDKDPALYESAIAELVKERHPVLCWGETYQILQTFVHLAFSKLTEDEALQKELLGLADNLQHAYVEFFKQLSSPGQAEAWDMLYCKKCLEEQDVPKYTSPPKRLKRNLSIKDFCGSPQFKRQQEKTQQAKRVLELENEIDERDYAIEAKNKEIESFTRTLKELQQKDAERRKAQNDQADEFLSLKSEKERLEQDCSSLQLKLESSSKRHKREVEEVELRAEKSASKDFQEIVNGLEKKIRDAEKAERDATRSLHERELLYNQLKDEVKSMSEASEQHAETIRQLEQSLVDARIRLREQEENLEELHALSSVPAAPGTPLSKYLEKDLQSELKDAKKTIEHLRADVELFKGTITDLEKESFETKSALVRAEDEVDSSKNRYQTLSTRNVALTREITQHKVRGEVLEEENKVFARQIEALKEELKQMTDKEMLQSLKREENAQQLAALQTKSAAEILSKDSLIAEIQAERLNQDEEISSLSAELEEANAKCSSEHERRSEITIALTEKERRLSVADSRIALLEESLLSSQNKIDSLKSDSEVEATKFKERDDSRLAEVQAVKAKNGKLQTELGQTKKEVVGLKGEMIDASTNAARLEGEVASKAHELKNFEHALRVKLGIIAETEAKLAHVIEESGKRDREAEEKLRTLTGDLVALEEEKISSEGGLKEQLASAEEKISSLKTEISEIQRLREGESVANKAEFDRLHNALVVAKDDNTEVDVKLVAMTQLRDSAQTQLTAKTEEVGSLSLQIEYLKTKMDKAEKEIEKTRHDHVEEFNRMREERSDLERALEAWKSRFGDSAEDMEKRIGETETELASSVERKDALSQSLDELQSQIQTLHRDLATRDALLADWRLRVGDDPEAGESRIRQLASRLGEAEDEVKIGVDRLREKEEEVGRLEAEMMGEKARWQMSKEETERTIGDLKTQLEGKNLEFSEVTTNLTIARSNLESLTNDLTEATLKHQESANEVAMMKDSLEDKNAEMANIQSIMAEAIDGRDKIRREKDDLEKAKNEEIDSMTRRLEEVTASRAEAEQVLRKESEGKVAEIENATQKIKDAEKSLRLKSEECVDLQGKLQDLEEHMQEVEQDLEDERSECQQKLANVAALFDSCSNQMRAVCQREMENVAAATDSLLADKKKELDLVVVHRDETLREKMAEMESLVEMVKRSREEMAGALQDQAKLKLRLQEAEASLVKANEEIAELDARRRALMAEAEVRAKEMNELQMEVDNATSTNDNLNETLRKQNKEKTTLEETLNSTEDRRQKLEAELKKEREERITSVEEAESRLGEKVAEIDGLNLKIAEAENKISELTSKAEASEESCKALEGEMLRNAELGATASRAEVAAAERALKDEKEVSEKQKSRLNAVEKDAEQLRAELEAAQSAALGFKRAEEELRERAEDQIADLKVEVERARQLGVANGDVLKQTEEGFVSEKAEMEQRFDVEKAEIEGKLIKQKAEMEQRFTVEKADMEGKFVEEKAEMEERLVKEKTELEERLNRMEDDHAVEKELLEATNTRHVVNLEKDKKKLEKKLVELAKAADEETKSKDEELARLKERLATVEEEKEDMERKVDELTVENEALMWGGMDKSSPEPKGRTFVKEERDPIAGNNMSLRSQVSSTSLSGQPPQPRLSSSRKNSQVDLRSQKSSSSLKSTASSFAAVNEVEEDFLGTPISLMDENVKRRETMAFGEEFKEQLLADDDDDERRRVAELKRRNTLVPSHLQSSYPVETSYCALKFNENTLQRGQDTPTTRSKAKSFKTSPEEKQSKAAPTAKPPPVAMEFSPPGRSGRLNSNRRESLAHAQTSDVLQFSPGPLQGKKGPRRVPRRLGVGPFNEPKEPSPVAEVRPMTSAKTVTKTFKPFQRAKPEDDMFEIITQATGHRIDDQVYDKPLPNQEHARLEAPSRPSPPSKALQKRKKADDLANNENALSTPAGPTPTKKPKKGLSGTPMKMLSNLKINTPKTKLKVKGNTEKASSSGPHLRQEASSLARSQESLNSLGTPSIADSTSQSLNSLNSVEESESSLKKGFSLRRKGSSASTTSRTSAASQSSEDEGKKKKSMRRSIMSIMK